MTNGNKPGELKMKRRYTLLGAITTLIVVGCGGGGGGGGGGENSSSSSNRISADSVKTCPTESMSPVDMSKLNCMVGHADGTSVGSSSDQKPCSIDITSGGTMTVTVDGQGSRSYELSKGAGTFSAEEQNPEVAGFSEYKGRARVTSENAAFETESWQIGSTTGSKKEDGSEITMAEQSEIKIAYFGPANSNSQTPAMLIVGAFKGERWLPDAMFCNIKL